MEKNVKFSVVTICYNVKDELKRTLRSLWAQTYGSTGADLAGDCGGYESIVVDGGSRQICRRLHREWKICVRKQFGR